MKPTLHSCVPLVKKNPDCVQIYINLMKANFDPRHTFVQINIEQKLSLMTNFPKLQILWDVALDPPANTC